MSEGESVGAGQPLIQQQVSLMSVRKVPAPNLALNINFSNVYSGQMAVIEPASNFT